MLQILQRSPDRYVGKIPVLLRCVEDVDKNGESRTLSQSLTKLGNIRKLGAILQYFVDNLFCAQFYGVFRRLKYVLPYKCGILGALKLGYLNSATDELGNVIKAFSVRFRAHIANIGCPVQWVTLITQ